MAAIELHHLTKRFGAVTAYVAALALAGARVTRQRDIT